MSILLSRGIVYNHDITLKSDIYLSMMDSNGLCKLNKIFIYKITEDI